MITSKSFLKWLEYHPESWGEDILKIKDCDEDYLVQKFTNIIYDMLTVDTLTRFPKLFKVEGNGWQGITDIHNIDFKIKDLADCQKIGIYLVPRIRFKYNSFKKVFIPEILDEDGRIVCKYILGEIKEL